MKAVPGALLGDAAARQLLGGASRWHTLRAGELEHTADGVGDLGGALPGSLAVVAGELLGEVDDPAGVHDEVRRIQDPARGERVVVDTVGELVVGGATHRAALQPRDRLLVQHAAQRARREDVAVLLECPLDREPRGSDLPHQHVDAFAVHVRHRNASPRFDEEAREVRADMADAVHDNPLPGERGVTVELLEHRAHGLRHAVGGHGRGVARAAGALEPGDPRRLRRDDLHVVRCGPDVLGRDVAAAEVVDRPSHRPQQRIAARRVGVVHEHDRLPSALVEPGGGRLQAHRL